MKYSVARYLLYLVLVLLVFSIPLPAQNYIPGQIINDPDRPEWLGYYGSGPFFMCGPGDPEGFLYRGTRNPNGTRNGDQMDLINKLTGTKANSIYLMAVRSHGGDGGSDENPFVNSDPNQGIDTDILDQWEIWFTEMDNNGIVIYFFFYDDDARIWNTGDIVGPEEQYFIHTIVDRFEHHRHLIWCVAEEYQEKYSAARVSNIAAEIKAADDHNHVVAVHKLHGLDFSEFANDPNIDQFAIQYNKDTAEELHAGMVQAWNNAAGRYNLNMAEIAYGGIGGGEEARKKSWAIAMGGAYVMQNGMDIENTPINDLEDCGRLRQFFEMTSINKMAPHDELKFGETRYVLALPDTAYILYSDNPGDVGVQNLGSGIFNFLWFDPVDGDQELVIDINVPAGNQLFTRPSSIGDEVALYMTREEIVISIPDGSSFPQGFDLKQNYPNPFNPNTTIRFTLPERAQISLSIYNVLGDEVYNIYRNEWLSPGKHELSFDASGFESGVYFYRLSTNSTSKTRKMILLK